MKLFIFITALVNMGLNNYLFDSQDILNQAKVAQFTVDSLPVNPYVFCGTGDHLYVTDKEPVDSKETIEAMLTWMSETYGIKRMYWRGGQEDIWSNHFKFGKETVEQYDYTSWVKGIYQNDEISKTAIEFGKSKGIETFLYTGLFESGPNPDVGIITPYLYEDKLRINHPEWIPIDRWGERRSPGPISFCYKEARKAVIDRFMESVDTYGYDGINFYTYVENLGIRYLDEFGFNEPIVKEFNKKFSKVNLREDLLSQEQKLHWYKVRGGFVTDFMRELSHELHKRRKKLSVIIDSKNPEFAQPWWGRIVPGTGNIFMDYKQWIKEGIVDELWVQQGDINDQKRVLDMLLKEIENSNVKLTVRTPNPLSETWEKYIDKGVVPVAVITWANNNGIEKYFLGDISLEGLKSNDWKERLQTLDDIAKGRLSAKESAIAALANDPNVLVRRMCVLALGEIRASSQVKILEKALFDSELCVRIAAVKSLEIVNQKESVGSILNAIDEYNDFPFKAAASKTLGAYKYDIRKELVKNLSSENFIVREVCVRAISQSEFIFPDEEANYMLSFIINNSEEDYRVRWWALKGLAGRVVNSTQEEFNSFLIDLENIVKNDADPTLVIQASKILGDFADKSLIDQPDRFIGILLELFSKYGEGCNRSDASFGWRPIGNAIVSLGGKSKLDNIRQREGDKWLAWYAYEVIYLTQKKTGGRSDFNLINESKAIYNHNNYAPLFPGWRVWN